MAVKIVVVLIFFFIQNSYSLINLKKSRLWPNCRDSKECSLFVYIDPNLPNFERAKEIIYISLQEVIRYVNITLAITSDKQRANFEIKAVPRFNFATVGRTSRRTTLGISVAILNDDKLPSFEVLRGHLQHEFLHILGFSHEHNHPDRDIRIDSENLNLFCQNMVYASRFKNLESKDQDFEYCIRKRFEKISRKKIRYLTSYDNQSIMHYFFPSKFVIRKGVSVEVNWGENYNPREYKQISFWDKYALVELYPGKVQLNEVLAMHYNDQVRESMRLERSKELNHCEVRPVPVSQRTESCLWKVYDGERNVPGISNTCFRQGRLVHAISEMENSRYCQISFVGE